MDIAILIHINKYNHFKIINRKISVYKDRIINLITCYLSTYKYTKNTFIFLYIGLKDS